MKQENKIRGSIRCSKCGIILPTKCEREAAMFLNSAQRYLEWKAEKESEVK